MTVKITENSKINNIRDLGGTETKNGHRGIFPNTADAVLSNENSVEKQKIIKFAKVEDKFQHEDGMSGTIFYEICVFRDRI